MKNKINHTQQKQINNINDHEKWEVTKIYNDGGPLLFIDVESIEKHCLLKENYLLMIGKRGKLNCICAFGSVYATKKSIKVSCALFGYDICRKVSITSRAVCA
tara:strand:+ start:315 stop:623 length:309 start_codon:yes stop_codon:yes gene_type:complete